jgi:hypothetical protein
VEAAGDVRGGNEVEQHLILARARIPEPFSEVSVNVDRDWQAEESLFLAALFPAVFQRLCLDDVPCLFVVLETATRHLGQKLFPHHNGCEPIGEAIIRFNGKPGELGSYTLVPDLALRITSILPLHAVFLTLR